MDGDWYPDELTARQIANFGLQTCAPIFWHDGPARFPKPVRGASCFFLRFDHQTILITAYHVLESFRRSKQEVASTICQVGGVMSDPARTLFDPEAALIDCDPTHDVATFRVSEELVTASDHFAIDCRLSGWPPPVPERRRALQLVGFPETIREYRGNASALFSALVALTSVEDTTPKDIWATYDPERDKQIFPDLPAPSLGFDMSGCSGGPALAWGDRNGILRAFPVGLIVGGGRLGEGDAANFDLIQVRRIHFVLPDGKIDRRLLSGAKMDA